MFRFDVVHRLFQQFFVHGGDRDLRGFGDVFPAVTLFQLVLGLDEVDLPEQVIHVERLVDEHAGAAQHLP